MWWNVFTDMTGWELDPQVNMAELISRILWASFLYNGGTWETVHLSFCQWLWQNIWRRNINGLYLGFFYLLLCFLWLKWPKIVLYFLQLALAEDARIRLMYQGTRHFTFITISKPESPILEILGIHWTLNIEVKCSSAIKSIVKWKYVSKVEACGLFT